MPNILIPTTWNAPGRYLFQLPAIEIGELIMLEALAREEVTPITYTTHGTTILSVPSEAPLTLRLTNYVEEGVGQVLFFVEDANGTRMNILWEANGSVQTSSIDDVILVPHNDNAIIDPNLIAIGLAPYIREYGDGRHFVKVHIHAAQSLFADPQLLSREIYDNYRTITIFFT